MSKTASITGRATEVRGFLKHLVAIGRIEPLPSSPQLPGCLSGSRCGLNAISASVRLDQHKGYVRSKGGNHRGSIFRLFVGTALIERDVLHFPTWDTHGNNPPPEICERDRPLQRIVSKIIGEMPFIWLAIDDEHGRDNRPTTQILSAPLS